MSKDIVISNMETDNQGRTKVKEVKKISTKEEKVTLLPGQTKSLGNGAEITNEPSRKRAKSEEEQEISN